ncbi:MAG TPA: hypothetical protein VGF92_18185 [Stellaceae bacterium]|jgi:hypothetical protein
MSNFVYDLTANNKFYLANGVTVALRCGVDEIVASFHEAETDRELRPFDSSKEPAILRQRLFLNDRLGARPECHDQIVDFFLRDEFLHFPLLNSNCRDPTVLLDRG